MLWLEKKGPGGGVDWTYSPPTPMHASMSPSSPDHAGQLEPAVAIYPRQHHSCTAMGPGMGSRQLRPEPHTAIANNI